MQCQTWRHLRLPISLSEGRYTFWRPDHYSLCRRQSIWKWVQRNVSATSNQQDKDYSLSPEIGWHGRTFNKTLATIMLSYVNEHHTNWDILLPYVMMSYRSAEHETTGCTPNHLMLGREVTTPLDLIYEPPVASKLVPRNWYHGIPGLGNFRIE